jgi:hypothetical protein
MFFTVDSLLYAIKPKPPALRELLKEFGRRENSGEQRACNPPDYVLPSSIEILKRGCQEIFMQIKRDATY